MARRVSKIVSELIAMCVPYLYVAQMANLHEATKATTVIHQKCVPQRKRQVNSVREISDTEM